MSNKTMNNETAKTDISKDDMDQKAAVQKKTSDNKTVFAPLGIYATVAVIMVSMIVTTAIMLDKQLNTVEQKVAKMESDAAAINTLSDNTEINSKADEADVSSIPAPTAPPAKPLIADSETLQNTKENDNVLAKAMVVTETAAANTPATAEISTERNTTEANTAEINNAVLAANETPAAVTPSKKMATEATARTNRQSQQRDAFDRHSREIQKSIEASKRKQKQHMTEMFARIKSLESKQLVQYKDVQNAQIERLRSQVSHQQVLIDALILRNDKLFEVRTSNMQRNQIQREAILNRI